ncbi:non-ribosomal peptide synthetase [Roseofilum casamattae]|uniref:Amino acid adenylation domain-containing protein n=1 Tax=Roseofilum casamattae BLCC-M143 TaxID=3022442 RepID=A0ABT7BR29_9CYAN|nr:non-ribosomal peptide synthetase [Roseofilum casamattae]MDJ1181650.1 amino acid adenylation domain-containing protein [Roseofilum casamattae BLCC-M143]
MPNNNQNLSFVEFKKEDIEQSVSDRFGQMVEQYPEKIAVKSRTATLTYAELDKASNRIARMLKSQQGDGLEPVGILMQQGAGFITAIMSVFKLGKICVPLDPKFPRKRLIQIIEDANMKALLANSTNMALAEELAASGCKLLDIDEVDESISSDKLEISVPPETLAYIIYTSGSTGRPKGVVHNHRNILHDARNNINAMKISAHDRITMLYSPSVMGAVRGIYSALLSGATSYTFDVREEGLVNLANWLQSEEITIYHSVVTLFRHFTSVLTATNLFPKLRLVVLGGEAVSLKDVELYKQYFNSSCILHVGLGSTEGAMIRQYNINKDTQIEGSRVPLGYAAEDLEVLLVDDTGGEVEPGQVGEIWIRSEYLALGYWQNPSKTAEAFIQDPEGSSRRIYRSGDLGKLLPDGRLLHQGRKDFQVKIRGFRVELAEIEQALVNHKSVKETVVIGKEDPFGEQSLVAYIVPVSMPDRFPYQSHLQVKLSEKTINLKTEDISHESIGVIGVTPIFGEGQDVRLHLQLPGETNKCDLAGKVVWIQEPRARIKFQLSPDEKKQVDWSIQYLCEAEGCFKFLERTIVGNLRNHLKEFLPDYMVPSAFVLLESLPLTPSGKIDRLSLPAPDISAVSETTFVATNTTTEERLAAIWAEVLGLEKVGIEDNFFEIGGHSLKATQVLSRIGDTFSLELPVRELFQLPTIAELAQRIEIACNETSTGLQLPAIAPTEKDAEIPLSFAQQRLWFLDRLEGKSATYNIHRAIRLEGSLNVAALEATLGEILHRHEVIRTTFQDNNGTPFQVISPSYNLNLPVIDLQHLPQAIRESEVQRLALEAASEPFDLATESLVRFSLLHLNAESWVLLLTIHHIVSDGWSMRVFSSELQVLYAVFSQNKPSPLPELPVQYADFAIWQRQYLTPEHLKANLNYWKQQLAGIPPLLELPTDRPRPKVQRFRGATASFTLSAELTQMLLAVSKKHGATLFMTLLGAFSTLLARYSDREDIVVGSPIANRNRPEIEPLVGFFVNTLVLRISLAENPSFVSLLHRVKETCLDAYSHRDLPFEQLVEELQPERNPSHTPLFQVIFALQNMGDERIKESWELPGLKASHLAIDNATTKFDITLLMEETETGLIGYWEYNTDLFDAATIERMMGHFQTLLEAIAVNPEARVEELPLLTATERHQLLVEWNDTFAEYPQEKCIHQLFEEQVERSPDAVAVVFEDERLTYRELNDRANQLAHYLQSLGVRTEVAVGIYLERGINAIVAVMAVIKAGGAYIPLDPQWPLARVGLILSSQGVSYLVTQQKYLGTVRELKSQQPEITHTICLDGDVPLSQMSSQNPTPVASSDNTAYIIYTSGSTGVPKGVIVGHKAAVNLIDWVNKTFGVGEGDRILFVTSLCFDLSVYDIFGLLAAGGSIQIASQSQLEHPLELLRLIEREPITFWDSAPASLQQLVPFLPSIPATNSSLRLVFLSGDWIPLTLPERVKAAFPGVRVVGLGGATEATIWSNYYPIETVECTWKSIPYGKPIQNARYYILDSHLNPCPIGVSGFLYIGGDCLAAGYDDPLKTAEKFIANPFSKESGERLYNTGDLARYLPNGNIEFIGRIDNQVKIRGFRIELGEIEATLAQHPEVREGVVIVREDSPGDKPLIAYIVPEAEELAASVLRGFLKSKLPDYMVPSAFVFLEAIPLTANGKIDRRALPAPDTDYLSESASLIPPRSNTELQLSQIWSEVLNVTPVGVTNNFVDLGGHSLLAVRLMARIERQLGIDLPLTTLFTELTIESQANLLNAKSDFRSPSALVPIQTSGELPPLFCVHPVRGNVLCYAELALHLSNNQPLYGLQSEGLSGEKEPLIKIEEMAAIYIEALQEIQPAGPYYLSGWSMGGVVAWEMARQLLQVGQEVALLALIDSYAPAISELEEIDEATLANSLAADLSGMFGTELAISAQDIQQLQPEEQLQSIFAAAKRQNLLPPEMGIEQMGQLFEVFKANRVAVANYQPQPYSGRVAQFCASSPQEDRGWSSLVTGELATYIIPGDHYGMMRSPHVRVLASQLNACLHST